MKKLFVLTFLLVLCTAFAFAQFSGKVCYVTPASGSGVGNATPTNADDQLVIDKLTSWGFTVEVAIGGNTSTAGSFNNATTPSPTDAELANYKLVLYSEFMSSSNGLRVRGIPASGPYNTINVPVVSLDNWFVRNSSCGFISSNTSSATTFINTTSNSVDFVDQTGSSFSSGFTGRTGVILTSSTSEASGNYLNYCVITPAEGQTILPIATVSGTTDQLIAWGAEVGTALYNNSGVLQPTVTLKKRYAAVGIMGPAYAGLTDDGWNLIKNAITWVLEPATEVAKEENVPARFGLNQNYPNPFNPNTHISFTLEKPGYTTLAVYNLLGQKVATVVSGELAAGFHEYTFDASHLTSGVYFYKLESGTKSDMKKMLLVK